MSWIPIKGMNKEMYIFFHDQLLTDRYLATRNFGQLQKVTESKDCHLHTHKFPRGCHIRTLLAPCKTPTKKSDSYFWHYSWNIYEYPQKLDNLEQILRGHRRNLTGQINVYPNIWGCLAKPAFQFTLSAHYNTPSLVIFSCRVTWLENWVMF